MAHPKSLLLIDHKQAQVLEFQALRKNRMRANQDVDLTLLGFFEHVFLFFRGAKARDHFDVYGKVRKPLLEAFKMLKAQHCSRRKNCNLLRILHGLERRAHGYFRFSITNIPT